MNGPENENLIGTSSISLAGSEWLDEIPLASCLAGGFMWERPRVFCLSSANKNCDACSLRVLVGVSKAKNIKMCGVNHIQGKNLVLVATTI